MPETVTTEPTFPLVELRVMAGSTVKVAEALLVPSFA